jgi:hypothetical protein
MSTCLLVFSNQFKCFLLQKLGQIHILVPFEVPESHCVETQLSHVPTEEQKVLLSQLGAQLKYKKFTPSEDAVIRKNWSRFRRVIMFNVKFVSVIRR